MFTGDDALAVWSKSNREHWLHDNCGNCTSNWIDVWMESNAGSDPNAVMQCENNWTRDPEEIQINPPSGLVVDTTPFFDTTRNQCNPVTW